MLEMLSQSWIAVILVLAVPVLIAGYFAKRAMPLTDAMRKMQEDGEEGMQQKDKDN